MEEAAVQHSLSYAQFAEHVGSTFHTNTPQGPIVLMLVLAVPLDDDPAGCTAKLGWRGPRQPSLPDRVVLYHPVLPPLEVEWASVTSEVKTLLYETIVREHGVRN